MLRDENDLVWMREVLSFLELTADLMKSCTSMDSVFRPRHGIATAIRFNAANQLSFCHLEHGRSFVLSQDHERQNLKHQVSWSPCVEETRNETLISAHFSSFSVLILIPRELVRHDYC